MARVKSLEGLSDFSKKLARLGQIAYADRVCKMALYDGAKVVADSMREEISALPIDNGHGTAEKPLNGVGTLQKEGLLVGFGIAPMRKDGSVWDTKAGFDGYNGLHTSAFPSGQPNAMIAASVESGTSFRRKNPFITRALRKSREKAQAAMAATADSQINQIMEES